VAVIQEAQDRRALRVTQVQLLRLYVKHFPVARAETVVAGVVADPVETRARAQTQQRILRGPQILHRLESVEQELPEIPEEAATLQRLGKVEMVVGHQVAQVLQHGIIIVVATVLEGPEGLAVVRPAAAEALAQAERIVERLKFLKVVVVEVEAAGLLVMLETREIPELPQTLQPLHV
jgi:hypothetical protein